MATAELSVMWNLEIPWIVDDMDLNLSSIGLLRMMLCSDRWRITMNSTNTIFCRALLCLRRDCGRRIFLNDHRL